MSRSLTALHSDLAKLRAKITAPGDPRYWVLVLEEGEAIPDMIALQLGPRDRVVIREYPKEVLGTGLAGTWTYGQVSTQAGTLVIWPDGRLERVRKR